MMLRRKSKTSISLSLKQEDAPKIKQTKNTSITTFIKNTLIIIPFMCTIGLLMNVDFTIKYFGITYPTNSNNTSSTSSLQSFESSLFCPLTPEHAHTSTINKYKNIISHIHTNQFESTDCTLHNTNKNTKYFILSMDDINRNYGFMATVNHIYLPPFTLSLYTDRIFLITDSSDNKPYAYLHTNGKSIPELCQQRTGRNCFFKPVSNCNGQQIKNILINAHKENNLLVINDSHKYCTNSSTLHPDEFAKETNEFKVIYYRVWNIYECNLFDEHGPLSHEKNRGIIESMIHKYNWNINFFQYSAVIFSFFIRLQNNINNIIINNVNKTLQNYNYKSQTSTMSLIMRGSDKCREEEMFCFNAQEFMETAKVIIDRNDNIPLTDMIVTSEDTQMIQYVKDNAKRNNLGVNLIFNDYDELPDTGNIGKLNDTVKLNEYKTFMFVISLLSTFKLQMHSDYYIIQRQSNWAHGIWVMTNAFKNCGIYGINNRGYDDGNKACADVQGLNKYWDVDIDGNSVNNDTRRIYWDENSLNIKQSEFNDTDVQMYLKNSIKSDFMFERTNKITGLFERAFKAPDVIHEMHTDYHRCYKKHRYDWE